MTTVILAVAALGTLYVLLGAGGIPTMLELWERTDQLEVEVARAERHNDALAEEVRALREDPEAMERLAREELGLARPGDTIYMLPPDLGEGLEEPAGGMDAEPGSPTAPSPVRRR